MAVALQLTPAIGVSFGSWKGASMDMSNERQGASNVFDGERQGASMAMEGERQYKSQYGEERSAKAKLVREAAQNCLQKYGNNEQELQACIKEILDEYFYQSPKAT